MTIVGVVLADQVRSLDWKTRKAEFIGKVPPGVLAETLGKVSALIATEAD